MKQKTGETFCLAMVVPSQVQLSKLIKLYLNFKCNSLYGKVVLYMRAKKKNMELSIWKDIHDTLLNMKKI